MRVFGGDRAISSAYGLEKPRRDNAIQMGFNAATGTEAHIIRVNTTIDGTPKNFEQQFWQAFLTISANPVGRVLLYRLLIEIRRVDDTGNGCCEDGIILDLRRNNLRTIEVRYTTNGFSFVYADRCINFDLRNLETLTLHINHNRGGIMGQGEKRPNNVALFHEMLHWFHYLRNFQKVLENKKEDALSFKYAMRCYYGDQSELCIWGANCNAEEISTILGIPNHNKANHLAYIATNSYLSLINMPHDPIVVLNNGVRSYIPNSERFLNGEDLSENAYRCSRGLHMRFGHTDKTANLIDILNPPLRYQLAHIVAVECYTEITGQQPINWRFRAGEAIKR